MDEYDKPGIKTPKTGILKNNRNPLGMESEIDLNDEEMGKRSVTFELSSPEKDLTPILSPFKI